MPNQTFSEELYDDTALKEAVDRMAEVMKTHATKAYVDEKVAEAGGDSIDALSEAIQAINTALNRKQDQLTIDTAAVEGSTNPISSGAVYTELAGKQNRLLLDDVPTENSENTVKSGGVYEAVSELKEDLDDVTDAVFTKSYNLVNCNSASFWTPSPGKNVSVSIPSENTVRVTSNVAQTYATARSQFIDVSDANTLYARVGNYSGTGTARFRIYGVSGDKTENPITVNRTGITYDVSTYDQVCFEIAATTGTASTGYIDYYELLVAKSSEPLPYVPYYQNNVAVVAVSAATAEAKADAAQDTATENANALQHLYVRSENLFNIDDISGWQLTDPRNRPVTVTCETAGTITVTAETATTYSGAYKIIDVRDIDSIYIHYEYVGGTGQRYTRLFDSDGSTIGSVIGTINDIGSTFDVSAKDYVAITFYAIYNGSGYSAGSYCTYTEIMICESTEPVEYEPYMIYEPIGTEALNRVNALSKTIIPLNTDTIAALVNAPFRSVKAEAPSGTPSVLSILHFSDLHADTDNLRRIVEFKTAFEDYIDDAICTGDMVQSKYSTTAMNFWKSVDGANKIMMCIGNHDVRREDSTEFAPGNYITQQAAYNEYIAPYATEWGIVYTQGHTYFYKDYTDQKIRMIVLDMMLVDAERSAQLTWFINTLASAKTTGFSVVIAQHFAPRPNANFECNFTALDRNPSTTEGWSPGTDYMDAVNDFINSGGDFICWLGGHTHCDYVCFNPNYTNQLFVTITCAACNDSYSDQARIKNAKSQDAFNVIAFDTYSKLIKILRIGANTDAYYRGRNTLTINYSTQNIVASN